MDLPELRSACFTFTSSLSNWRYLDKCSILGPVQKKTSSVMLCHPLKDPQSTYVLKTIIQSEKASSIIQGELLYWSIPEPERKSLAQYYKHWQDTDNFYIILKYYPQGTLTSFLLRKVKAGHTISPLVSIPYSMITHLVSSKSSNSLK